MLPDKLIFSCQKKERLKVHSKLRCFYLFSEIIKKYSILQRYIPKKTQNSNFSEEPDMIEPVRSILKLPHKITVSKLQRDYSQDDWSKSK